MNVFLCDNLTFLFLSSFVCSTILEEEKLQQKERNRMEMRRQVTVSWDSGGSDEAPPKVRSLYAMRVCVSGCLLACSCEKAKIVIINNNCCVGASRRRTLASLQVLLRYLLLLHSHCVHLRCGIGDKSFVVNSLYHQQCLEIIQVTHLSSCFHYF